VVNKKATEGTARAAGQDIPSGPELDLLVRLLGVASLLKLD
jgi:hypothetical protein